MTTSTQESSLYVLLLRLPVGAALVLSPNLTAKVAERAIKTVIEIHDPRRRYAIGEHIARPNRGKAIRHVRIERLSDET
jgi:hypothetical protein